MIIDQALVVSQCHKTASENILDLILSLGYIHSFTNSGKIADKEVQQPLNDECINMLQ